MAITKAQRSAGIAVDHKQREKDDFYDTPPEATIALMRVERFVQGIWECACGDGAISKVLEGMGKTVVSTDLVDRGYGQSGVDFLMERKPLEHNIITNPPFKLADEFMQHAQKLSRGKVAFLMRLQCLSGQKRQQFFEAYPPARIWVFSNRIKMNRGGSETAGGSMFDFMWVVWHHCYQGRTKLGWINTTEN